MTALRDVVAVLDSLYPPATAEGWDAVGPVLGDPDQEVRRVLVAVDPVLAVVDEAVDWGADLVLVHHPLFLTGVTSVAAVTPKGAVVQRLARAGIALHTCHTNADVPALGVSEAMAHSLGVVDVRPLEPAQDALDSWTVYVPLEAAEEVAEAMWSAGAGSIGDYDRASFRVEGTGTFRPVAGAQPAIGAVGSDERVDEAMIRLVARAAARSDVRRAMTTAHPYEEVAHEVVAIEPRPAAHGHGRIGRLAEPTALREFAASVRDALPAHGGATRVAGDLDRPVRTVAVCGGSGDFLLGAATAAGADVFVTSDLKHHTLSEHREEAGACAVVDVPHWAAEWTWCPVVARELAHRLADTVETRVSTIVTDPWSHTFGTDPRSTP